VSETALWVVGGISALLVLAFIGGKYERRGREKTSESTSASDSSVEKARARKSQEEVTGRKQEKVSGLRLMWIMPTALWFGVSRFLPVRMVVGLVYASGTAFGGPWEVWIIGTFWWAAILLVIGLGSLRYRIVCFQAGDIDFFTQLYAI
jgi:hypothetical protein